MAVKQKYTVVIDQFEKKRAVISNNIVDGKMEDVVDIEGGWDIVMLDVEVLYEVEVEIKLNHFDDFGCEYQFTLSKDGVELYSRPMWKVYSSPIYRCKEVDAYKKILFYFHLNNVLSDYGLWHILDGVEA